LGAAGRNTISVDADRQPFWLFMRDLCRQSGYGIQDMDGQLRLSQGGSEALDGPLVVSGPFAVTAIGASQHDYIGYSRRRNDTHTLQVQCSVLVEPKIRLAGRTGDSQLEEATDDLGQSLVPPQRGPFHVYGSGSGQHVLNMMISLAKPPRPSSRLVRLRGSIQIDVVARSDTVEIDNILSAANRTVALGNWTLRVKEVKPGDGSCSLEYVVSSEVADMRRGFPDFNHESIALLDADGRRIARRGHSSSGKADQNNVQYECSAEFSWTANRGAVTGPPAKLVWELPVEVRQVQVPFEFKDLPLPRPPE
jgi:hypothetical protein